MFSFLSKLQVLIALVISPLTLFPQQIGPIWLDLDDDIVESKLYAESMRFISPTADEHVFRFSIHDTSGTIQYEGEIYVADQAPDWRKTKWWCGEEIQCYEHGIHRYYDNQGRLERLQAFDQGEPSNEVQEGFVQKEDGGTQHFFIRRTYKQRANYTQLRYPLLYGGGIMCHDLPFADTSGQDSVFFRDKEEGLYLAYVLDFAVEDSGKRFQVTGFHPNGERAYVEKIVPIDHAKMDARLRTWNKRLRLGWPDSLHFIYASRSDTVRRWHPTGELAEVLYFESGKPVGWQQYFHPNGQLAAEWFFTDGKKDSIHQAWYPDGRLKKKINFQAPPHKRLALQWWPNGQLEMRVPLNAENQMHGLHEEFNEKGVRVQKGRFKDGKLVGKLAEYDENGKLIERKDPYQQPQKKQGEDCDLRCSYLLHGKMNSFCFEAFKRIETYFPNTEDSSVATQVFCQASPDKIILQTFFRNGQMASQGEFRTFKEFARSKVLMMNGLWQFWDSLGSLIHEKVYVGPLAKCVQSTSYDAKGNKIAEQKSEFEERGRYVETKNLSGKTWYPNGQIQSIWKNENGNRSYQFYAYNGQILMDYSYQKVFLYQKHGRQVRYSLDGEIVYEADYFQGKVVRETGEN